MSDWHRVSFAIRTDDPDAAVKSIHDALKDLPELKDFAITELPKDYDHIESPDIVLRSPIIRRQEMTASLLENLRAELPIIDDDKLQHIAYLLFNWHIAVRNGVLNRIRAYAKKTGDWEKAHNREYFTDDMIPGKEAMEAKP